MKKALLIAAVCGSTIVMPTLAKGETEFHEHGFNRVSIGYLDYRLMDKMPYATKGGYNIKNEWSHLNFNGFTAEYLHGFKYWDMPVYVEVGGRFSYNHKELGNQSSMSPAVHVKTLWQQFPSFLNNGKAENEYKTPSLINGPDSRHRTIDFFSFTIPVNVSYKFDLSDHFAIQPFVGVYGKVHMLGHVNVDGYFIENSHLASNHTYSLFDGNDMSDPCFIEDAVSGELFCIKNENPFNRFQFGVQGGVGFSVDRFYMGMSFGYDITPLYKSNLFGVVKLHEGQLSKFIGEKLYTCEWAFKVGINF